VDEDAPMPLYAQHAVLRARQVAADLGMLAWTLLWVLVARVVHEAVLALAEPGRAVEELGASLAGNMGSAAESAGDVPIVGDELSAPFEALSEASGSVVGAGQAAQDAVATRHLLTGTPELEILAARAMATASLDRLAALPAGTGAAWRGGDPAAVRALAGLELARLGLRLPAADGPGSGATSG
jgi:hypothetical protein